MIVCECIETQSKNALTANKVEKLYLSIMSLKITTCIINEHGCEQSECVAAWCKLTGTVVADPLILATCVSPLM